MESFYEMSSFSFAALLVHHETLFLDFLSLNLTLAFAC